jgi:hypothetical protein
MVKNVCHVNSMILMENWFLVSTRSIDSFKAFDDQRSLSCFERQDFSDIEIKFISADGNVFLTRTR